MIVYITSFVSPILQFEQIPVSEDRLDECRSLANLTFTYSDVS